MSDFNERVRQKLAEIDEAQRLREIEDESRKQQIGNAREKTRAIAKAIRDQVARPILSAAAHAMGAETPMNEDVPDFRCSFRLLHFKSGSAQIIASVDDGVERIRLEVRLDSSSMTCRDRPVYRSERLEITKLDTAVEDSRSWIEQQVLECAGTWRAWINLNS